MHFERNAMRNLHLKMCQRCLPVLSASVAIRDKIRDSNQNQIQILNFNDDVQHLKSKQMPIGNAFKHTRSV